ncbi:MAG: ABC transporter substrate-binding protein [Acidimicrobiales bacterium]|nr:ABC transporter substrate-binding protein [Acidimicrobiales bacterium]
MARGPRTRAALATIALVGALAATACTETVQRAATGPAPTDPAGDAVPVTAPDGAVIEGHGGEEASFGTVPDEPIAADGEPLRVGMINQEDTPLGSFPELRLAVEAGIEWINTELGGVDGRPLELDACITNFSVERSQACAQQMVADDVVAVIGGIDITSNGSIPILEQNDLPYVGGIPVNLDEERSPVSFQFSGGTAGAFTAFAWYAAEELGAEHLAVVYAEYPPIQTAARDYGVAVAENLGVERVDEVAFGLSTTDFLPVLSEASAGDPDAILFGAADTSCLPVMQGARDLGITAPIFLVGACAAPSILAEAGPAASEGRIFNVEGRIAAEAASTEGVDADLYNLAVLKYGDGLAPAGAGTVTFRGLMNLYAVMTDLGADDVSPEAIIERFRDSVDVPSFNGHP